MTERYQEDSPDAGRYNKPHDDEGFVYGGDIEEHYDLEIFTDVIDGWQKEQKRQDLMDRKLTQDGATQETEQQVIKGKRGSRPWLGTNETDSPRDIWVDEGNFFGDGPDEVGGGVLEPIPKDH